MKILVCISHVPDTTSKINFVNGDSEFDTNGVQYVINPNDEFGLTRAIWFQEQQGATVTVVNVGGPETEPTLRKALAIGANEAIRVNANPTDGFFVAKQLAEVIQNGGYDVIIAGKESLDYNGGMVPGMIAGILGYNFLNSCTSLTVDGTSVKAVREIDGGKETVATTLPLIIGGQKGLVEEKDLRIPNMRGIMTARTKALTILEPVKADANTKEVKLSDDGKELYRYARQMIDLQKKIEERFETGKSESKHLITIAASTIPAQYLLPEILMKFNERYPKEQVKLLETDSSQVVTKIIDHMVDVGFTGTVLEKKHCKYIPFYKDELVMITPNTEKYQVLHQNIEDISWISGECLIMREEGSGTRKEAGKQLRNAGINLDKLKIIASIENQETIKKSVKQGMGISIISRLAAEEEAKSGDLLTFPIPKADQGRDINLVYNKNYQMSKSAERFIKVVKEVYGIEE